MALNTHHQKRHWLARARRGCHPHHATRCRSPHRRPRSADKRNETDKINTPEIYSPSFATLLLPLLQATFIPQRRPLDHPFDRYTIGYLIVP